MEFIIDRSKWRCGQYGPHSLGQGQTMLLNYRGFSDIIGQCLIRLGIPKEDLRGKSVPNAIPKVLLNFTKLDEAGMFQNTSFSRKVMRLNDAPDILPEDREIALQDIFEGAGHKLTFEGKPVIPQKQAEA